MLLNIFNAISHISLTIPMVMLKLVAIWKAIYFIIPLTYNPNSIPWMILWSHCCLLRVQISNLSLFSIFIQIWVRLAIVNDKSELIGNRWLYLFFENVEWLNFSNQNFLFSSYRTEQVILCSTIVCRFSIFLRETLYNYFIIVYFLIQFGQKKYSAQDQDQHYW